MKTTSTHKNSGFSLVEMLVAILVGGLIVSAVYSLFILQNKSYVNQNLTSEMQQNVRMAMNILSNDFRMAGFGFSMSGDYKKTSSTVDYAVTPTNNSNSPDSVTIRYGINPDPANPGTNVSLKNAMANSNSGISMVLTGIDRNGNTIFPCTNGFSINGYIIVSNGQDASRLQVTGINSGTSTLQYNAVSPSNFPTSGFAAGSRVYKLRQVSYRISSNILQSSTDIGVTWQDVVNNIEDLQLAYQGTTTPSGTWLDNPSPVNQTTITDVQLNILGLSGAEDLQFMGQRPLIRDHAAGSSDHYRRRLLTSTIRIRNL